MAKPEHDPTAPETEFDRELNLRAIIWSGVGLALVLIVSAALMWPLTTSLRGQLEAADPPPPLLPEARIQPEPPGPRLQARPEEEMRAMRAEEDRRLESWEWIEEGRIARVPIERALEIAAEHGLPGTQPPPLEGGGEEP